MTNRTDIAVRLREVLRGGVVMARLHERGDDLPTTRFTILAALRERPRTVAELARLTATASPTISQAVSRLAAADLVRRVPDADDARVVLVELTGEGERVRARAAEVRTERMARVLRTLDDAEMEMVARALPLLERAFREAMAAEGAGGIVTSDERERRENKSR